MKTILLQNKKYITSIGWAALIAFFSFQMLMIVLPYTSWEWDVDFLITKQHVIHLDYYRVAFYSHIFSSVIVLLSGAFLFSDFVLKKMPKLHRVVGKTYVFLLLLISAPSGIVMAFYANGGWMAQLSFLILTPLWWWFTYQGYRTARQRKFKAHKKWMIRSYALTFSAITLRVAQMILGSFFYLDTEVQYILVSWGSWILNLMVVELWMYWKLDLKKSKMFNFVIDYHKKYLPTNRIHQKS